MKTFRFQTIQLTSVYVYIITVLCIKSTFVFRLKIGILQLTFENVCIYKHIMNSHRLWEWLVGGGAVQPPLHVFNPHSCACLSWGVRCNPTDHKKDTPSHCHPFGAFVVSLLTPLVQFG